ncbi:MAG: adenylate/guanylate cyclase domain-containing protein, partial [Gammaproteobacteria bacterium]|nr:adenylate/guanylate cyclase domain-containing protein [Gammaproteobacteria bacterium]
MEVRRRSRELAVVVHADVAGYSGLMEIDEDVAHARVTDYFDVVEIVLRDYGGSILEKRGDAILVDFKSASPAVAAALRAQEIVAARNKELTDSILPLLRIGIHLGEVIKDRGTVWGAGANMAQRVEQLATPGGVAVSSAVFDAITKSLPFDYEELGASKVKNTEVKAYRVRLREGLAVPEAEIFNPLCPNAPSRPTSRFPVGRLVLTALVGLALSGLAGYS